MRLDAEANLQAEFYHQCRLIDLQLALEVTTPAGRLDAAILTPDRLNLVAIVEVKRSKLSFNEGRSRQILNYKALGVPVYGLDTTTDPKRLARSIQIQIRSLQGKPLTAIASMVHLKVQRLALRHERKLTRLREDLALR